MHKENVGYMYTTEFYSDVKKNEIAGKWIELKKY